MQSLCKVTATLKQTLMHEILKSGCYFDKIQELKNFFALAVFLYN